MKEDFWLKRDSVSMARSTRLAVIQSQYDQKRLTKDEALELLSGPLTPGDASTTFDDSDCLDYSHVRNMSHSHEDYILQLEPPYTVKKLKPLIGKSISVKDFGREWGKRVLTTDTLTITDVRMDFSVRDEISVDNFLMIYSDYKLDGKVRFNAWTRLARVQKMIKEARLES